MKNLFTGKVMSLVLAALLSAAVIPVIVGMDSLLADDIAKTQDDTCLGTSGISSPEAPTGKDVLWAGSYVYFGNYYTKPIRFRVLSPSTTKYGGTTVFLDSDEILYTSPFDGQYNGQHTNVWADSPIRKELNEDFYNEYFTGLEKSVIATSVLDGGKAYPNGSFGKVVFGKTVGLNDKIFLLDYSEVTDPLYGYSSDPGWYADGDYDKDDSWSYSSVVNRAKLRLGEKDDWWLRSADIRTEGYAGLISVPPTGRVWFNSVGYFYGIAPAMNIDKKSVLFSSLISGEFNSAGAEYKLTVIDKDLTMTIPSSGKISVSGSKISIPYSVGGADADNATRVSVLVLNKEYTEGNSNNADILFYAPMDGVYAASGTKTFSLPDSIDIYGWDKDFYVYIVAEDVNGEKDTDYASVPVKVDVPEGLPAPTASPAAKPTGTAKPTSSSSADLTLNKSTVTVVCGKSETLKATLKGSKDNITWKSSDTKIATVDSNGKITTKQAGTVTITASAGSAKATCTVTVLYKDVTNTKDFWYAPTNYLTAKGVVKGYDKQTKFKPANDCTRAQMVTFLYRLQGEPKTKSTSCKFKDVKKTDYFFKPVIWAVEKGITTGVSKTKFDPQGVCTRAQTVTFLWRMANKPAPKASACKFSDVKKKDYFYNPVIWASEQKIVAGYSDGTFRPQGKCLRRQMVTFLYKYDKFVNKKK
ncbi:MAG: S-layer homology domain-containing protein [Clostridiales bacterium]|nr:S-layer homology domain-containing protein [Clostridiales bacterium]